MARLPSEHVPYKLSALPHMREVCALGGRHIFSAMFEIEGARVGQHQEGRYIAFPATRESMMAAEAIASPVFTSPEYMQLRRDVMAPDQELLAAWRAAAPPLRRALMRHQEEFCALAYGRRGMFNASEQGTGKTATAIALAEAWKAALTVVVCPKSIMQQWASEWGETVEPEGSTPVVVLDGARVGSVAERVDILGALVQIGGPVAVVVNYDVLHAMAPAIFAIAAYNDVAIVFDESWRIKDSGARVTKAAIDVAKACVHVLCLTGTPMGQGVEDLWSQIRVVTGLDPCTRRYPREGDQHIETLKRWKERYESTIYTGTRSIVEKKCKDPVGLMRRLGPVFYRATKASCLDLPEKLPPQRVRLEMSPEMRAVYRQVERDGEAALGDHLSLMGARTTRLRLQQIVGGFVFNPDGTYSEEEAGQPHDLRLAFMSSPKMQWCMSFAEDQLAGDPTHRVILWCKFNSEVLHMTSRLGAVLGKDRVVSVTAATSDAELEEIRASVNSRDPDGVQVVCAQIKKVAYGGNWQAVDTHVYYSHTWSHVEKSQSADRSHRIGRTGAVRYVELIVRGSIDEDILASTDALQDFHVRYSPDTTTGPSQGGPGPRPQA